MATHDYVIANQGFPAFRSDLNDALAAIVSNNSSATEPTTMFAHQIWVDTAANPSVLKIRNADNDAWITIGSIDQTGDTFTLTSAVSATTLNTSGAVVFNDAGADVDFRVEGDTEANLLFVDASADAIGMGTNAPSELLHLKSATADKPVILLENTTSNDTTTGNAPSIRFYSNDSNQAGIPDNAELGIIEFRGDDKDGGSNRNYAQIKGLAEDPGGTYKGAITFSTASGATPTERARITSEGYFKASNNGSYDDAAGTYHELRSNASGNIIFVFCNSASSSPVGGTIKFSAATPNNTTSYFLLCSDSTNSKAIIYSDGSFQSRANSYGGISDVKLKQDIVDANSQWDDIKNLRVRKFRMKDEVATDPNYPSHLGVIAQEAELVSPGLVFESPDFEDVEVPVLDDDGNPVLDEDGNPQVTTERQATGTVTKGVKYSILYMKAVKALQEAIERIETLEANNAALEARLSALEQA